MELNLKGKHALVTASTQGLGLACAEQLVREGASVFICGRDRDRLDRAMKHLREVTEQAEVHGAVCDLADSTALRQLSNLVLKTWPRLDILVLSTGHPPTMPFSEATDSEWQTGVDLLLRPVVTLIREFLPAMRQAGYGRIIAIGSIFGIRAEVSSVIQSTYRAGLNSLAKCVAVENGAAGVTCNVLCPGYFDTPLVRELAIKYVQRQEVPLEAVLSEWRAASPAGKFGRPEDLGALVSFLASPRAEFINGATLTIDGAATA